MNDSPGEDWITVMATTDETAVAIARSILDDAEIAYRAGGAGLRKFGGSTFLGATLGPCMGQVLIRVHGSDYTDASELLEGPSGAQPHSDQ